MSCETAQQQVSLLIDAELEEAAQVSLFRHLEGCSECRCFFDSMVRFRKATRTDREEIFLEADELLSQHGPLPVRQGSSEPGERRWLRALTAGWRIPVPMGVVLAVVLLFTGALVGVRLASVSAGSPWLRTGGGRARPAVVVVCGLPEVEVVGTNLPR